MKTKSSVAVFLDALRQKNPHEPEFLQAVQEIAEDLIPFIEAYPQYQGYKLMERLVEPERVVTFRVTWVDDDGDIHVNRGYRVQMNSAIGPYKGGLRFHPTVTLSVLKFLAFEQVFKNSLTSLPMGGGKGGSDFDPKGKSDAEIMRFCQAFMTELSRHIGADLDVPAGDIGVGARELGYMYGQYKRIRNEFTGVLTGKALSYGGSHIRPEATGYGLVYFVQNMLANRDQSLDGKKVLISGSGNVAQFAAEKVLQMGGQVLTLSDSGGCIYDPQGIDLAKLEYVKTLKNVKRGRIMEYVSECPEATYSEGQNPWGHAADIALPCATQNELDKDDARALAANGVILVAEGANMPCTEAAKDVFKDQGILYAPGKASNAGGVATSGLEMSQNSLRYQWSRDEVDERLQTIMENIHKACIQYGTDPDGKIDYNKGANIAGFVKVADAMIAQGIV